MIHSMTGYGRAAGRVAGMYIVAEIRTLNSKTFELSLRLPPIFKNYEYPLRTLLLNHIHRGKADVVITIEENNSVACIINHKTVDAYVQALKKICREHQLTEQSLLPAALSLPGALVTNASTLTDKEWKASQKIVLKALEALKDYRKQEGKIMQSDMLKRIRLIKRKMETIRKLDAVRRRYLKSRLKKHILESDIPLDENRLEQELIYYLEKIDFTEELVRLKSHLDYFIRTTAMNQPAGKKLGFILQEINREVNTLGAKAAHAPIQKVVIEMKEEVEKIKEQLANVL
jgi:uncharacterized protein (TIGR00255 family)